jgi:hypothetical protein
VLEYRQTFKGCIVFNNGTDEGKKHETRVLRKMKNERKEIYSFK